MTRLIKDGTTEHWNEQQQLLRIWKRQQKKKKLRRISMGTAIFTLIVDVLVAVWLFNLEPWCVTPWQWVVRTVVVLLVITAIDLTVAIATMQK